MKYDNLANIAEAFNKFSDFKTVLINLLNTNPLISYYKFKREAKKEFFNNDYEFTIKKSTLANIYYPWRSNAKFLIGYQFLIMHILLIINII